MGQSGEDGEWISYRSSIAFGLAFLASIGIVAMYGKHRENRQEQTRLRIDLQVSEGKARIAQSGLDEVRALIQEYETRISELREQSYTECLTQNEGIELEVKTRLLDDLHRGKTAAREPVIFRHVAPIR